MKRTRYPVHRRCRHRISVSADASHSPRTQAISRCGHQDGTYRPALLIKKLAGQARYPSAGPRWITDTKLDCQVLHHRPRNIQRVLKKRAQIMDRARLKHEPQPVVITPTITNQIPVSIIEEEKPLQIRSRWDAIKAPIRRRLRIRQEPNRHRVDRKRSAQNQTFRSLKIIYSANGCTNPPRPPMQTRRIGPVSATG